MIIKMLILLLYLFICMYTDIKTRTIPLFSSLFFSIFFIVCMLVNHSLFSGKIIASLLPSIFLICISLLKPNSLGLGDGVMFIVIGLSTNFFICLYILLISLFLSSIFSLILLVKKYNRHYSLPLAPFIFVATLYILIRSIFNEIPLPI